MGVICCCGMQSDIDCGHCSTQLPDVLQMTVAGTMLDHPTWGIHPVDPTGTHALNRVLGAPCNWTYAEQTLITIDGNDYIASLTQSFSVSLKAADPDTLQFAAQTLIGYGWPVNNPIFAVGDQDFVLFDVPIVNETVMCAQLFPREFNDILSSGLLDLYDTDSIIISP